MPTKLPGETREVFIDRCIPVVVSEGKPQDQAFAICNSMYDESAEKPKKSRLEVIVDFKKLLEKNGLAISEDTLESLFVELKSSEAQAMTLLECKLDARTETQEIMVFPKKKVFVSKYNEVFNFDDIFFDAIINNFNNDKLFKPFGDEQHSLGVKFFDISRLEKRDDGLYAIIDLNEIGKEAIKNRKYSYISPQWGDRVDTEGNTYHNVLMAITLTNIPALEGEVPPLQEQITLEKENQMNIDKKIVELSTKLDGFKLQGEVDPAVVMTVITESLEMIEQLKVKLQEITGQKEEAEEEAQVAVAELSKIKVEKETKEQDDFFLSAIEKGKIQPSEEEHLRKLYSLDKDTVVDMVEKKQEKKEEVKLSSGGITNNLSLAEEDYYVMSERGLDKNNPEDIKIYLEANK